jgi:hypothetical protein
MTTIDIVDFQLLNFLTIELLNAVFSLCPDSSTRRKLRILAGPPNYEIVGGLDTADLFRQMFFCPDSSIG